MRNKKLLILLSIVIIVILVFKNWDLKNFIKSINPQKGDFIKVGKMSNPRYNHEAILLDDGTVLVFGGMTIRRNFEGGSFTADIYNPKTKKFKPVGKMVYYRWEDTATKLKNGKILVTGGRDGNKSSKNTQLYNPATRKFEKGPDMNFSRIDHAATLLQDGRVLITGGQEFDLMRKKLPLASSIGQSEIYDPKTNKFTIAPNLNISRFKHSAILLNDGRVLIIGGFRFGKNEILTHAEVFDPRTNKFELVGSINIARIKPYVFVLKNGNVIILGGYDNIKRRHINEIELYNPKINEFKIITKNNALLRTQAKVLLKDDKILLLGGCTGVGLSLQCSKTSQIYNTKTNEFIKGKDMNYPRDCYRATLLNDDNVLVTGSVGTGRTAELYLYK